MSYFIHIWIDICLKWAENKIYVVQRTLLLTLKVWPSESRTRAHMEQTYPIANAILGAQAGVLTT